MRAVYDEYSVKYRKKEYFGVNHLWGYGEMADTIGLRPIGAQPREGSSPSIPTMKEVKFVQQGVLVKKNVIEDAMTTLSKVMKKDKDYRYAWFCNLKFAIYDNSKNRVSQKTAEEIADVILKRFFNA